MRAFLVFCLCLAASAQTNIAGKGALSSGTLQAETPAPVSISPVTPPRGTVSTSYSFLIPVAGGIPPYTCTLLSGTLPNATTLSVAPGIQGCQISGLLGLSAGGVYSGIVVQASDTLGSTATNSPAYSIVIVQPQTLGPPSYLGAIQSLAAIQLPNPLPALGTNACPGNPLPCYTVGIGTEINDATFNPSVPQITVRATDSNSECGRPGFSQYMTVGGSGDANMISAADGHFIVNDQGNAFLMFSFNPTTYAIAPMYASIYGCPGGRGVLTVPSGEWSYSNDNLYWGLQTAPTCAATSCPNPTSVSMIDVSSPTAPTFTAVFDFKNCLPAGSPTASWTSQGGVDVTDRYFAMAASITGGGQNTGGDAMFFDRTTQVCYLYDTIGNIDPARTAISLVGATATYTKTTQQVVITLANSFISGQTLYMVGITGALNPLNGYAIKLTTTSTSTLTGTLTTTLGHADISGTFAGAACSGTPTVACANIGTMAPAIYKFVGSSCGGSPNVCSVWTQSLIGYVPTIVGSKTVHNDKIGKNGSFDVVDYENCLTVCQYLQQIGFWQPESVTPSVLTYNNNGGHWTEGNRVWVNEGASSNPYFSWEGFPITNPPTPVPPQTSPNFCTSSHPNPGNAQCLILPIPGGCNGSLTSPVPCIITMDGHPNWNTNNPTFQALWGFAADTTPIITDIESKSWVYGTPFFGPFIEEVVIVNACVFNSVLPSGCNPLGNVALREGHTYNSGLSLHFDTAQEIGVASPDGKFYFVSSDYGGQLGQEPSVGVNVTITNAAISTLVGTFTYSNPAGVGVVNTSNSGNTVTWVSGSKFNTAWTGTITINSVAYTLVSCTSVTLCSVTTPPGAQTGVSYSFATTPLLTAGQQVALYGFNGSLLALNGAYATVSATGLTSTQFEATLPAGTPNTSSIAVNASATVVTCLPGNLVNCRGDVLIIPLQ